jgi:hypothetical protein
MCCAITAASDENLKFGGVLNRTGKEGTCFSGYIGGGKHDDSIGGNIYAYNCLRIVFIDAGRNGRTFVFALRELFFILFPSLLFPRMQA